MMTEVALFEDPVTMRVMFHFDKEQLSAGASKFEARRLLSGL